jgi:tripartite-type tricarboxylate transporter receptor subunit TctC
MLKTSAGIDMLAIPYKGQGPMFQALLAGEVDVAIVSLQFSLAHFKSGRLQPLAVTSKRRSVALPEVPTVEEVGYPGFEMPSWHGIFVPTGTPRDVVNRLQREAARVVQSADVRQRVESTGNEVVGSTPEEFDARYRADVARFKKIVKDAGLPYQD